MFCEKCGKSIPDDSVFCPECGEEVVGIVSQGEDRVISESPERQDNTPTIVLTLGIASIIGLCVSIGFIPAIVALVMGFKDIKKNGQNAKTTAGMICAAAAIVLTIVMVVAFIIVYKDAAANGQI